MMKVIANHFEIIYYVFYFVFLFTLIQPRNTDVSISLIGSGVVTAAFSTGVIAVFFQEKSRKAFAFKSSSVLLIIIELFIGGITHTSYTNFALADIPTWLRYTILIPPSLMFFLAISTVKKVRKDKKAVDGPSAINPYLELSKYIQSNSKIHLPTYEISSVLPIKNSEDKIVMLKYTESFNNVLRCKPDGTISWQAELPTASNDVYTNVEWKDDYLMAFSRSCMTVKLDEKTGRILPTKNVIKRVAA